MTFPCTCTDDARYRCPTHRDWPCHDPEWSAVAELDMNPAECPPCRTARWASVNLDSRATPTRRER